MKNVLMCRRQNLQKKNDEIFISFLFQNRKKDDKYFDKIFNELEG